MYRIASSLLVAAMLTVAGISPAFAQVENSTKLMREYAGAMLDQIHRDLERNYYDPAFGGVDIKAERERALSRIKSAGSASEAFTIINEYVSALKDSHTTFYPPMYADLIEYGVDVRFHGAKAYVSFIEKGGSAERAGLRVGDEISAMNGRKVERASFAAQWNVDTFLSPADPLVLTAKSPNSPARKVMIRPTVKPGPTDLRSWAVRQRLIKEYQLLSRNLSHVYTTVADSVLLWRMPVFGYKDKHLKQLIDDARKHQILILDMRGNSGGALEGLEKFAGMFFDRQVTLGTLRKRKGSETLSAIPSKSPFMGKLIVLIDSETASSAEIFAHMVQREKRGIVLGDKSAGAVMASMIWDYQIGLASMWFYGAAITIGEFTTPDGAKLETVGVTPDETIITTGAHLAGDEDPVLSRALAVAGVERSPAEAGGWLKGIRQMK